MFFFYVNARYKVEKIGAANISGYDVYKFTEESGTNKGPAEPLHYAAISVKQAVHNYSSNILYDAFHKT